MVSSTHEHHEYVRRAKFALPVQREAVQQDWEPRGFSCDAVAGLPGLVVRDAVHHHCDGLVAAVSGSLLVTIGVDCCALEPGDEAFIPAGAKYSIENAGQAEALWLFGLA